MYDFDEIIDRRGTGCVKYDCLMEFFGRPDLVPLWVADMDFRTPDFITGAVSARAAHPVYGYTFPGSDYFGLIAGWIHDIHGWDVDPSHIRYIPGIVKGIAFAERCFLQPGDKVVIQPPVYHPFRITTEKCGFVPVYNPLVPKYGSDGFLTGYEMDLEGLERICRDPSVRMLVLSNPHNPCGIAWDAATLREVARICRENAVIAISDEIHAEMALDGRRHVPFASTGQDAEACSIVFMAPSKTFNIAGIVSSYCIIGNPELRGKFFDWLEAAELDLPSIFSIEATKAAYTFGKTWREEMLEYVSANADFVDGWLRSELPQIRAVRPQASFLVWLDCRKLGLSQTALTDIFVNGAGLALNDGSMFGAEGIGFMRLNIGCPRSVLEDALKKLKNALK